MANEVELFVAEAYDSGGKGDVELNICCERQSASFARYPSLLLTMLSSETKNT